jgi:hypothetical protein
MARWKRHYHWNKAKPKELLVGVAEHLAVGLGRCQLALVCGVFVHGIGFQPQASTGSFPQSPVLMLILLQVSHWGLDCAIFMDKVASVHNRDQITVNVLGATFFYCCV